MNRPINRLIWYIQNRGFREGTTAVAAFLIQFLRGLFNGYWLVFIGKGVRISHRKNVKIGRFTRIEDYVELDGFGEFGLKVGEYCKVGRFSILRVPGSPFLPGKGLLIGDRTTFAEFCFVGGAGMVVIGEGNAFGQYVSIHPQNHLSASEVVNRSTREMGLTIGNDNWVGAKATFLDESKVGNRCIVGACALVRGQFGDDVLIAGVPAEVKKRLRYGQ